jgi:O-succinylbenzoic acid--CoA ligase
VIGEGPWLAQRASLTPEAPALVVDGETTSWVNLHREASIVTAGLHALGIGPGDRIALLAGNDPCVPVLLHATLAAGAVLVPLNTRLTAGELAWQLSDARPALFLHGSGPLAELAREAAGSDTELRMIEIGTGADSLGLLHAAARENTDDDATRPRCELDSPCAIIYTSGTTARPRGAILTRGNFFWSAMASALHLGAHPQDRWLACMPLFHVGGLSILLRGVLYGCTTVLQRRFDPVAANDALDGEDITLVSLAPVMLERLLDARDDRPAPGALRCVLLGGGPAAPALVERALELGFPVAPTYGLTEAASQVATHPPHVASSAVDAALRPLPGTRLRVVDEAGADVPEGVAGQILVQAPTVMAGYWERPEDSAEALRGGWLHTGDIGTLDERGFLRVLDRRSDLIVSGGENIYPAEVEAALREHPDVLEVGVAAVSDAEFGQRPAAWLVLRGGGAFDEAELRDFCRRRLAGYKVPVTFHPMAALPRNASGKLLRRELRRTGYNDPAHDS